MLIALHCKGWSLRVVLAIVARCLVISIAPAHAADELLQKPIIPRKHIAELQEELARLGWGKKSFDEVAQAVVDADSPELAFRLLLETPEDITLSSAARHGQMARLRLLHLAEQAGFGPLVSSYPTRDVHSTLYTRQPEAFEFIVKHWEVKPENESWLADAARYDLPQVVDLLIDRYGGEPWLRRQYSEALSDSAWNGHHDIAARLLDAGADPNALADRRWFNPLQSAVWQGQLDTAELLLQRGAKLDACSAAGLGKLDDLKRLLDEPLLAHLKKSPGPLPLFWAARRGQSACLTFLLERGADPNAASREGHTPLHAAVDSDDLETIRLLLKHKADPHALCESDGYDFLKELHAPIHRAATTGKLTVVQLLLDHGVSPWARAKRQNHAEQGFDAGVADPPPGNSALTVALQCAQPMVVDFLLQKALDELQAKPPTLPEIEAATALAVAAAHGDAKTCRALLLAGVPVNTMKSIAGDHPLKSAASAGQAETVKLLLAAGAKPDGAGEQTSDTPLHAAARAGHGESVRLLLDAGAAIDARTPATPSKRRDDIPFARAAITPAASPGKRPLMSAIEGGHLEVAKLLLERGANPDLERTEPIADFLQGAARSGAAARAEAPLAIVFDRRERDWDAERNAPLAKLLIAAGARLDPADPSNRWKNFARYIGDIDLLEQAGVKIDAADVESLATAITHRQRQAVKALLARGANPLAAERRGLPQTSPFHVARRKGQTLILATIIEASADVPLPIRFEEDAPEKLPDGSPNYAALFRYYGSEPLPRNPRWLLDAIAQEDFARVEALLRKGYDPNEAPKNGSPPLKSAVWTGDLAMVQLLARHGASLDRLPDGGSSLLVDAALLRRHSGTLAVYGHAAEAAPYQDSMAGHAIWHAGKDPAPRDNLKILQWLLQRGADPNRANPQGDTPLHLAVAQRKLEAAEMMLDGGARHDAFTAAGMGRHRELAELIDADAAVVRSARADGRSPLDWAIAAGERECAELLLSRDAPLARSEKQLVAAVSSGNHELLDFLLQRPGGEPVAAAALGKALAAAIRRQPQAEMVRVLLAQGADAKSDPNLLIMAAQHGDTPIIELLVAAGAPVNATVEALPNNARASHRDISALHAAMWGGPRFSNDPMANSVARIGRRAAALKLLELGADPRRGSPGVLRAAVGNRDLELVRKLLAAGANVNDATSVMQFENATPLHVAVAGRDPHYKRTAKELADSLALIDLLLEHGANPKISSPNNYGGRTPLDLAKGYGDDEVVKRLEAAPARRPRP